MISRSARPWYRRFLRGLQPRDGDGYRRIAYRDGSRGIWDRIRDDAPFLNPDERTYLWNKYYTIREVARPYYAPTAVGIAGATLSASNLLFRPKGFSGKKYPQAPLKHMKLINNQLHPRGDPPPMGDMPPDPPPLVRQDAIAELPPLKSAHHDGCDEDLLSDSHYLSRTPYERYVRLSTVYDSGLCIAGASKFLAYILCPNLLYRTFDNLPGAAHPLWCHDAEFWNLFYKDHHVYGFQVSITVMPYQDISESGAYVVYLDKGYGELAIPLATLADLQDWESQSISKRFTWGKQSLSFSSTDAIKTLSFPYIDCCKEFGSSIANDNRLDETNIGTYTIATDPKFYILHLGYAQTHASATIVPYPRIQVRLTQDVKFYNPVSNVHA